MEFTLKQVAHTLGAKLTGNPDAVVTSVCIDSRKASPGTLFFALSGENADGHDFLEAAFAAGAAACIVSRQSTTSGNLLLVDDTTLALGALARSHRLAMSASVVGVTGSVGKTSTRNTIAHVLSSRLSVYVSPGNFNTEYGLPMAILELTPDHEACVLEMGMRGPGQIAYLADIAVPTVGVITNIGSSHLELLGSRQAIAAAKAELLDALPADGLAVLPADDEFLPTLRSRCRCRVETFGYNPAATWRITNPSVAPERTEGQINGVRVRIPLDGDHHLLNAAAAIAVGEWFRIDRAECAARLETLASPSMRLTPIALPNGTVILNDAYNAAPASMRSALRALATRARAGGQRSVAILGDMRELGSESDSAHIEVGRYAEEMGIDLLVAVGQNASLVADSAGRYGSTLSTLTAASTQEAIEIAIGRVKPGDVVLVKGSRALAMEQVVDALENALSTG